MQADTDVPRDQRRPWKKPATAPTLAPTIAPTSAPPRYAPATAPWAAPISAPVKKPSAVLAVRALVTADWQKSKSARYAAVAVGGSSSDAHPPMIKAGMRSAASLPRMDRARWRLDSVYRPRIFAPGSQPRIRVRSLAANPGPRYFLRHCSALCSASGAMRTPIRLARHRSAPVRSAPRKSALRRSASLRSASLRSALARLASCRLAPARLARRRFALCRSQPDRSASLISALLRLASCRLRPARLERLRLARWPSASPLSHA